MNDLNSTFLEGRLVRDPEMHYGAEGAGCCTFSVANNRYYKRGEEQEKETSYFDVKVWGRQAETCKQYLKQGRGVRVVGRLKQERWEKNGQSFSKVVIYAEHVDFMPAPKREASAPRDGEAAGV